MYSVFGILFRTLAVVFPWFSSVPPGKCHYSTSGRPWLLLSKFILHQSCYSSVLCSLDAESELYMLIVGALEIDEVRASDQGSYRCNASSLDQHRLSIAATLSINMNLGELVKHFKKLHWSDLIWSVQVRLIWQHQVCFMISIWHYRSYNERVWHIVVSFFCALTNRSYTAVHQKLPFLAVFMLANSIEQNF